ncbi:ATP-dependent zinc metalloprotease FtsH [Clostridium tyrobutyricum]|jgi:cell division protease FtsH|uniref:ATP-dependent zinc metalloprotease FtsH n=1 Tax=Clostridium tyrobutyricum TaxID=1519 RepID=UPI0002EC7736|nr:ATP-dependent zinc metalloprotease FtsH [Clostridium tyrobutyricum]MBV4416678.1 ATP-dependent zinc metalloprotease FtsH [Clostridium tyrobutyricum]MBV4422551.1 ATP-dependent zinc metalloprotease FtsH [Clostridium tyrobutyricum]MBV4426241.1 ATP-dependent zinc metalloprotease FtsH [Clostridium tyrobutyricum]MBV4429027.1 ATP-dependent zinc metalloprotease FtsH [Clostridium tyrobutyricum]MBV4431714.1 ATP-dependent zinc metalloprotease FtsH [Clostridium tyrobutyricum]
MKKISSATAWMVIFVLVILVALLLVRTNQSSTAISFNQFQKSWLSNNIKSFQLGEDKMTVRGSLKNGTQYETIVPSERLFQFIGQHPKDGQVQEMYAKPATIPMWVQYLPTILLVLVLVAVWFMFMQQSQGGGGNRGVMNFGKSRAKMATPDKQKVTFDDVAGAEEEKQELAEIVDFLKQPKRYIEMGARIPKGVLLVGPPGTGKTLLAKAISGEAGVPFFSISGSDFVEMFVGVGASRVRDLFDQAKKNSPCIVFIDEIDAVGRQRGAGLGGGHDEREQTLNQLLVEMDGFGQNEGIIMIAATNRPDILDPALLRPGRFDRQILVGAPDVKGREEILKVHSKNKHLSDEVKLDVLAKRTPGFTGADLENLMNEAALLAVRKNKSVVEMEELEEAVTRVVAGPEKKSRVIDEEDRKLTAYHEAGHAVVMQLLPTSDPVHEISIIPRGMAGGYTMHLPEKDTSYMSKTKLEEEIIGLLGGRVAEKIIIGDISTGAKNDIERATTIARKMVMDYGMSGLGPIAFGSGHDEVFLGRDLGKGRNFSEEVAFEIDKEIRKLIDNGYKRAEKLLTDNINKLHAVAKRLLEKEKVEADEFLEIFNQA